MYFLNFLFLIVVTLFSNSAFSKTTSLCWENDCRSKGWSEFKEYGQLDHQCIRGDCLKNGWIKGSFDRDSYISCMNSHCETDGFYEIKRNNQHLLSQTVCLENQCNENGSLTYFTNGAGIVIKACRQNDCSHYGWQSTQNGNILEDVECLSNDCLKFGWVNYK